MRDWAADKQVLKKQIVRELRRKGQLPRNGSVEFTARIKKNPRDKHGYQVVIDQLRIHDRAVSEPLGGEAGTTRSPITEAVKVPCRVLGRIDVGNGQVRQVKYLSTDELTGGATALTTTGVEKEGGPPSTGVTIPSVDGQKKRTPSPDTERKGQALPASQPKSWWQRLFGF